MTFSSVGGIVFGKPSASVRRSSAALGALILAWAALAAGQSVQAAPVSETLVVAISSDPVGLEPADNKAEPIGSEIIVNVFDTLVAWATPDFQNLEGRLAKSWTMSADDRVFTFELRDGVKFQDGTDFDAEAVKFSLQRTRDLNPYMKSNLSLIEDIVVDSPLRITIYLSKSMPVFPALLAQPQAAIVSPAAVRGEGAAFATRPVGTGAFKLLSYSPDSGVVLERNPGYFRGPARLGHIVYRVIPDASTRRLELESGGIDISQQNGQFSAISKEDLRTFRTNPELQVIETPSQIVRQLEFNNSNADSPIHDLRVRQAMGYAIDYQGLLDEVLGGAADRVYGPLPSSNWAFAPDSVKRAFIFDPGRAKRLLAEAGYKPGQLKFTLYTFQGSLWRSVATFIQGNLADVGITVTVEQTEFPNFRALHTAGKFEIALDGRAPWYNDPDAHVTIGYLSRLAGTAMTFRMPKDDDLDGRILAAQSAIDPKMRRTLYIDLQQRLMDRVPAIYLFSSKVIIFARANVKGLIANNAPPLSEYWGVSKQ